MSLPKDLEHENLLEEILHENEEDLDARLCLEMGEVTVERTDEMVDEDVRQDRTLDDVSTIQVRHCNSDPINHYTKHFDMHEFTKYILSAIICMNHNIQEAVIDPVNPLTYRHLYNAIRTMRGLVGNILSHE